jgi:hypothetical protein
MTGVGNGGAERAMDPRVMLLELDERCREVLCSPNFSIRRHFGDIHREIDLLRIHHPNLTEKLESLYRKAKPGRIVTTGRLISFAFERNLRLTGEPFSEDAPSP